MVHILVIEDERNILENIVETLEIEGFEVTGADNGREGVEIARTMQPDLILCDIMMPDFDGYNVLMTLRSDVATATTPFIFLTALAARSAMRQGMEMGADDYLTKPFTPVELVSAVNTRLDKHQTLVQQNEEKIDRLRSTIIYALPHELRTPLTGIIGCAEFLQMDYENIPRDSILNLSELMLRSAARLQRVIENYLLYAQLELTANDPKRIQKLRADRMEQPERVIAQVAQDQAAEVEREADLRVEAHTANIAISNENLGKIVTELIENAFKFSKTGTDVVIQGGAADNQYYKLCVNDQGRGMTDEQIRNIGAYVQFDRKLHEQQGLGLGLVIAKQLVELHGGELSIESVPNQGTTVCARLPLASS